MDSATVEQVAAIKYRHLFRLSVEFLRYLISFNVKDVLQWKRQYVFNTKVGSKTDIQNNIITKGKFGDFCAEIQASIQLGFGPYIWATESMGPFTLPIRVFNNHVYKSDGLIDITTMAINKTNAVLVYVSRGAGTYGLIGQQGPAGPKGPKGDTGPRGPSGTQGPHGKQGPRGIDGKTGPPVAHGPTGPRGPAGGPKGDKGVVGATGPAGEKGERGPIGAAGAEGATGPKGVTGSRGPAGGIGPVGPRGEKGAVGQRRKHGEKGEKGKKEHMGT